MTSGLGNRCSILLSYGRGAKELIPETAVASKSTSKTNGAIRQSAGQGQTARLTAGINRRGKTNSSCRFPKGRFIFFAGWVLARRNFTDAKRIGGPGSP